MKSLTRMFEWLIDTLCDLLSSHPSYHDDDGWGSGRGWADPDAEPRRRWGESTVCIHGVDQARDPESGRFVSADDHDLDDGSRRDTQS